MISFARPGFAQSVAITAIFAIAGTLTSCGRYGSPVRPGPSAASESTDSTVIEAESPKESNEVPDKKSEIKSERKSDDRSD